MRRATSEGNVKNVGDPPIQDPNCVLKLGYEGEIKHLGCSQCEERDEDGIGEKVHPRSTTSANIIQCDVVIFASG